MRAQINDFKAGIICLRWSQIVWFRLPRPDRIRTKCFRMIYLIFLIYVINDTPECPHWRGKESIFNLMHQIFTEFINLKVN
jgi:hypothetical protein